MALKKESVFISEEAYLKGELETEIKNEYIDGQIYAMGGASYEHNILSATISRKFGNSLEKKPCDALQSDFKVRIGTKYFYPDILVKCDKDNRFYTEKPIIIVEVASESTRKLDRTYKLEIYKQIPSLIEYVLVEQDKCLVEIYKRDGNAWKYASYTLGDIIYFESIDDSISVEEMYERVDNEDMRAFLSKLGS